MKMGLIKKSFDKIQNKINVNLENKENDVFLNFLQILNFISSVIYNLTNIRI